MKVLYLNQPASDPVNLVYIKGLRENGIEVFNLELKLKTRDLVGLVRFYWKNRKYFDLIMIGHDNPQLAIFTSLISGKKIIYNAPCSKYERLIISRGLASRYSLKAAYYWLLDFIAVHFVDLTVVETDHQAEYFKKIFKVSGRKIFKVWSGVDGDEFFYNPAIKKRENFTVVFRGRLLPEAGAEYAIEAAKILEKSGVNFLMLANGQEFEKISEMIKRLRPANLEFIKDFLPSDQLRVFMQSCHLSLGQLSDHDRLTRTISHKTFEGLAMKLPYLTAAKSGVLELLTPNETCLTCDPADAKSLAEKILWAKDNYSLAEKVAENGYELYQKELKSNILARALLDRINTIS